MSSRTAPRRRLLEALPLFLGAFGLLAGLAPHVAAGPGEADPPVTVDGLGFPSWAAVRASGYFEAAGLRCGTANRETRALLFGPGFESRGGAGADCSAGATNPGPGYDPGPDWEIPVVVHVIMDSACNQGAISDALVHSQIEVLNEDLLALPGTNGGNGRDAAIRFVLATEDPAGQPTTGITRSCNTTWFNDGGSYWNSLAWDPHRYLNIYTNTADDALGYVPFLPADGGGSQVGSAADRVVVLWSSFGRNAPIGPPYDQGRTTTHEVGHFLGLEHTFTGGCAAGSSPGCYSNGDLICDTNPEQNPGSSPCHVGASSSCGSVDPTDNYMDYSDDLCMERFTTEQTRRIRCTLLAWRPDLYRPVGGGNTAPTVTISAPGDGSSFPPGASISFSGSATDVEDGTLTSSLTWSSSLDGPIGTGGSFSRVLSTGVHTVTAAVTDAGGASGADSISVTVTAPGNQPPSVTISAPAPGAAFPSGASVAFSGSASDPEDGNLTGSIRWTSDRDGFLGSGGALSSGLSDGAHLVTAAVTDSGGSTRTDTVALTVGSTCAGGALDEDFESGASGWSTSGLWHLATSSGCAAPAWSSPVRAMYFGREPGCDYDTGDRVQGTLVSPPIAGLAPDAVLSFDHLRQVEGESDDGETYDRATVQVAVDGSETWTTVWSRSSDDPSTSAWSASGPIGLAGWAGQTVRIRFRFDSVDELFNEQVGWMIDDVRVTGGCAAQGDELFVDGFESGSTSAWSLGGS